MKSFIKDNLIFINEENPKEKVIFNFYSWVRLVEGTIVKYCRKSPDEAKVLVESSSVCRYPIEDYLDAMMISHNTEYHWALFITYGNNYWEKGISSDIPDDWYDQYILKHNLAKYTFNYYTENGEVF